MEANETPTARARLILTLHREQWQFRSEDGHLPLEPHLGDLGFQPGDLVEIRLLEHCPQFGIGWWAAERKDEGLSET